MVYRLLILVGLSFLLGCAHSSQKHSSNSREVESFRLSDPEPPQVVDEELEIIPTEINPRVEQWLAYFQGRGRPHMERYLSRMTRYSHLMKRILRQKGMPEDLIYIALIESGFSSRATSRAAAVGYWQFIKGTGRRYGLEINAFVDERRDPVLSTEAAAEYFKGLYSVFGSWYLAMASYNVGENRVQREVMKNYTRDFWELAKRRRFPKETVNYVPKFIAAKLIGKNPEKYGFKNVEYEKPIEFELIRVDKPVNLKIMAEKMGIEYDDFKQINPKFRGELAPLKQTGVLELRVPAGQTQTAMAAVQHSFVTHIDEFVADAGETETYRVKSGDSLYSIARRFRTTVAWLRDVNDIKAGKKLRIGMRMQVPDGGSKTPKRKVIAKAKPVVKDKEADEKAMKNPELVTAKGIFYIVQPGDTLSAIADEYDSSISELRRMNRLSNRAILKVGMKLKVPKDDTVPKDVAEAAVAGSGSSTATTVTSTGITHTVRSGENLTTIAKKYGVTIQDIQKVNKLTRKTILKIGLQLTIPTQKEEPSLSPQSVDSGSKWTPRKNKIAAAKARKTKQRVHVVKRGENLTHIAKRYRISLQDLIAKNSLRGSSKVMVGARLMIPVAQAGD